MTSSSYSLNQRSPKKAQNNNNNNSNRTTNASNTPKTSLKFPRNNDNENNDIDAEWWDEYKIKSDVIESDMDDSSGSTGGYGGNFPLPCSIGLYDKTTTTTRNENNKKRKLGSNNSFTGGSIYTELFDEHGESNYGDDDDYDTTVDDEDDEDDEHKTRRIADDTKFRICLPGYVTELFITSKSAMISEYIDTNQLPLLASQKITRIYEIPFNQKITKKLGPYDDNMVLHNKIFRFKIINNDEDGNTTDVVIVDCHTDKWYLLSNSRLFDGWTQA